MALRKPLVIVNGQIEQLQSGDTLNAPVTGEDIVQKTNDNGSTAPICTPVYVKSNGNVDLAKADASGTTNVFGLVADAAGIASAAAGSVQVDGVLAATTGQWDAITGQSGGLTPGAQYYLSSATAGLLTSTAPTAAGKYVAPVGIASSTTDMLINPKSTVLL
jgi:hypothetical protein